MGAGQFGHFRKSRGPFGRGHQWGDGHGKEPRNRRGADRCDRRIRQLHDSVASGGTAGNQGGKKRIQDRGPAGNQPGGGTASGGQFSPGSRRTEPGVHGHSGGAAGEYHHIVGVRTGDRKPDQGYSAQRPQLRYADHAQPERDQLRPEDGEHLDQQRLYVFGGRAPSLGQYRAAERDRIHGVEPARDHTGRRQRATAGHRRGARVQRADRSLFGRIRQTGGRAGDGGDAIRHQCAAWNHV